MTRVAFVAAAFAVSFALKYCLIQILEDDFKKIVVEKAAEQNAPAN